MEEEEEDILNMLFCSVEISRVSCLLRHPNDALTK